MNKLTGPKQIPVAQIKTTFYVRAKLDDDRVLYFAEMYQNGVKVPPILINKDSELIDGRHRLEALKYLELTSTNCLIADSSDRKENIVSAIKANLGGALPPTSADMEQAVELLLAEKMKISEIKAAFPIPPSVIQKYIDNVKRKTYNRNFGSAIDAIVDRGWTVARSADHFGIDESELKAKLSGRRKRKASLITSVSAGVEFRTRGFSQFMRNALNRLQAEVVDGGLSRAEFDSFCDKCKQRTKKMMRVIEHSQDRMDAAANLNKVEDDE